MDGEWREDEGDRERKERKSPSLCEAERRTVGVQAPTAEPERAGGVDWR